MTAFSDCETNANFLCLINKIKDIERGTGCPSLVS
jgi:hypothetical protein